LHLYLNSTGLAHSWLLCTTGVYEANKDKVPNLASFTAPAENEKTYFYTKNLEARVQRSFYIKKSINELMQKTAIDVIVAHGSGGFPLQVFGEFDVPIVTYIEFPSFGHHGHSAAYPQPDYATFRDKIFEMTSYHQALKSDLVIVPSKYAKTMFPVELHGKIVPQMEGFDIKRQQTAFKKESGYFYVGYTARDLSSAKGFEKFIILAKKVLKERQKVKFVFCGSPKVLYSYEEAFLHSNFPAETRPKDFMSYLLEREGISLGGDSSFQHVSFAAYADFASFIEGMDLFVYPLQFGSANWGLFEILFRGRTTIASDRCFVPEVIEHNRTGMLCPYDDDELWVRRIVDVIDQPERFKHLGDAAAADMNDRFHISKVAPRYLDILTFATLRKRLLLD
ncbi:MAG: hypothetical protein RL323_2001, partial [Pseudomonadota bacterium]